MRADRARGLTIRQIANDYDLRLQTVHRVVGHVPIVLPNAWHRARLPREAPLPALWLVHRYRAPPR